MLNSYIYFWLLKRILHGIPTLGASARTGLVVGQLSERCRHYCEYKHLTNLTLP